MKRFFPLLLLCFLSTTVFGQQYLYLKKTGTAKLKRVAVGDSIGFKLFEGEANYMEGRIRAMEAGQIFFDFGSIPIAELHQIRTYRMELYFLSRAMNRGSIVLVGLMVVNGLIDGGVLIFPGVLIGSAAVFGASFAVRHWSRPVHSKQKGWRFELIDFKTVDDLPNTPPNENP